MPRHYNKFDPDTETKSISIHTDLLPLFMHQRHVHVPPTKRGDDVNEPEQTLYYPRRKTRGPPPPPWPSIKKRNDAPKEGLEPSCALPTELPRPITLNVLSNRCINKLFIASKILSRSASLAGNLPTGI